MQSKKRRPTSSSRTHKGKPTSSHLQPSRPPPHPSTLLIRKYLLPALQEEDKHTAYLLTRFLTGHRTKDTLNLAETAFFYCPTQALSKLNQHSFSLLSKLSPQLSSQRYTPILMSPLYFLLVENSRKKKELFHDSGGKREELKTTAASSKKQIKNILGDNIENNLNESEQLGKLSKCLKKVLKMHGGEKGYRAFVGEMEKKNQQEQSHNMMELILNLEKDFSSIQQEGCFESSKESIYGLSDLKKKCHQNSKIELKAKQKKSSFPLRHLHMPSSTATRSPNTSQTRKSISLTRNHTPEPRLKSKSKSMTRKPLVKPSQRHKLTDTQKLYYDQGVQKQQKNSQKSSVKDSNRKSQVHLRQKIKKKVNKA